MGRSPLLRIRGLGVDRGGVRILDGIDWTIEPGQHWAVIGPNGCGKTALLNAILAYADMGRGTVELFGQRYGESEWQMVRRRVGLVSTGIARQMDDAECARDIVCTGHSGNLITFVPPTAGLRRRAGGRLRAVGADAIAGRPWRVLSQGERTRTLIARALMADPGLLFLDEPCLGLDPVARESFLADLQGMMTGPSAPAVVMVTHHLEELPPATTHALLLRAGRVVAAGSVRSVLTSRGVSACFGAPLRLRRRGGRYRLESGA